jgi:hypothetical protein
MIVRTPTLDPAGDKGTVGLAPHATYYINPQILPGLQGLRSSASARIKLYFRLISSSVILSEAR